MKSFIQKAIIALLLFANPFYLFSQEADDSFDLALDSLTGGFEYQYGTVSLYNGIATLQVPAGYKFLDKEQSNFVLTTLWGNPPSDVEGLLFPDTTGPLSAGMPYAVEIYMSEDGHVDDDDASDIDYDDLLEDLQEETRDGNEYRRENGYPQIELVGWAARPYYDAANKKLHWAKELHFDSQAVNTLNYNIRVLGRRGYLVLNAIGDMDALPYFEKDIDVILGSVAFNEGEQYEDFDSDIDKVAAYGIGGLIAGKVLAKAGFFVLLLKFWKVIAIGAVGLFSAFRKKIFGSKHKEI